MKWWMRPWCWLKDHEWKVISNEYYKRGPKFTWIRRSVCTRCGLQPY